MSLMTGKVAIVTGATQGIGLGIARRFAREGARLVVCSRSAERGPGLLKELADLGADARYVRADVGIKTDVAAVVAEAISAFGKVDVLVNNAQTVPPWEPLETKPDSDHEVALLTGYYASLWSMQAVFPHMRDAGGGRIINFASAFGIIGARYAADYNASKEAIRALTRTAANEWGRHNINVNVILPAAESEATKQFKAADPEAYRRARSASPIERHGDPERDIGGACVALSIDDGRFITGESLFVDGGMVTTKPAQVWKPSVRHDQV